jgi:hypothetical protein
MNTDRVHRSGTAWHRMCGNGAHSADLSGFAGSDKTVEQRRLACQAAAVAHPARVSVQEIYRDGFEGRR